jgi:hypothetical protein
MAILSVIFFFHFWQIETRSGDGPKKYLALVAISFFKKTVKDSLISGREKKPPKF